MEKHNPFFSSGPCKKYSSFSFDQLNTALLNRSHRSVDAINVLINVFALTKKILNVPDDFHIIMTSGGDTCAVETCLWNLLGVKDIDIFVNDSFSKKWADDIQYELKLPNINIYDAEYGELPNMNNYNADNDAVFILNATTSGVKIPNLDWIPTNRNGLTICDATSIMFATEIDWTKIDAITYSWQKVLGGEPGFGMIIFNNRVIDRLNTYNPPWPIPVILKLKKNGVFNEKYLLGHTNNTFSLLLLEDYYYALKQLESDGGVLHAIKTIDENYMIIEHLVSKNKNIEFFVSNENIRSHISVTLTFPNFSNDKILQILNTLEKQNIAYDIKSYASAPKGLRIWCGPTIKKQDIDLLCKWLNHIC